MLNDKHYEFFRILNLSGGKMNHIDLYDFSESHTTMFEDVDDYDNVLLQLRRLGYIEDVGELHLIQFTPAGKKLYKKHLKEKRGEAKEKWPKQNWILADVIKIAIGLVLGYVLRIATEPKPIQQGTQTQSYQVSPKTPDSLHKDSSYMQK
jgi:hypothetical protein